MVNIQQCVLQLIFVRSLLEKNDLEGADKFLLKLESKSELIIPSDILNIITEYIKSNNVSNKDIVIKQITDYANKLFDGMDSKKEENNKKVFWKRLFG